jgi:uncharacterized protein YbjT (DUF2867 family)
VAVDWLVVATADERVVAYSYSLPLHRETWSAVASARGCYFTALPPARRWTTGSSEPGPSLGGQHVILVIGGGSRTGRELIRLLQEAGTPVRAMVRQARPAADGADTVYGDLAKPATLEAAMEGADKVFLLGPAHHDEAAWYRSAIDAAARAGVSHLVASSILGSDPASPARFIRHHGLADAHLRESGLPWTILRPNMYMHNVTSLWPPTIGPDGNYYAPAGDARISTVDARDAAAVAARVLTQDGHAGEACDLTGPQALTTTGCCELLGTSLRRPVHYVEVDDENARGAMLGAGLQHWMADALIELYQDYRRSGQDGYAAQVHDGVQAVTGRPPRTLAEALAGS